MTLSSKLRYRRDFAEFLFLDFFLLGTTLLAALFAVLATEVTAFFADEAIRLTVDFFAISNPPR
jgi:hypothetical protein